MQLTVQGKQIDIGDALRTHVGDKIEDLNQKYFNHATDATITFSKEGHGHGLIKAHIHIRIGKNIVVMADATENEPYLSFDAAAEKVAKQLRRYKSRLKNHHDRLEQSPEAEIIKARGYTLAAEAETEVEKPEAQSDDPLIVAEMTTHIETLSVREAVMRMDLADLPALMFRNTQHDELNMVYRRPDGNVGWIDPAGNGEVSAAKSA